MRRALALLLAFCLSNLSVLEGASIPSSAKSRLQDEDYTYDPYSPEELDNLLAPIALYPDPLLSQVLVAATFVDDVDEAARWVRANGTNGVDDQPWDVSVKAVAHYPTVIAMMADKLDWTTAVGQAYVNQSTDVMTSVQRLRRMAHNVGNLVSTPEQEVIVDDDYVSIVPFQPQYIYVPVYDPYICYYRRPYWGVAITFGIAFLIGAWLNRDCDWHHHRIYYHGWDGPGWIHRCRPYVHVNNVYVDRRYSDVHINRDVIHRNVGIGNIERYNAIHRDVDYRNIRENNARLDRTQHARPPEGPARPPANNRVLNRNIDTGNPRLDRYRGREGAPGQARPPQPTQPQPQPQPRPQPLPRPTPPPVARPTPPVRPTPHVFNPNEGNFDPRASGQRGQSSRQQAAQPRPAPRPAPQPRASNPPAPRSGGQRRHP